MRVKIDISKYEEVHGCKPAKWAPKGTSWTIQYTKHKDPQQPDAESFKVGGNFEMCMLAAKKAAQDCGYSVVEVLA